MCNNKDLVLFIVITGMSTAIEVCKEINPAIMVYDKGKVIILSIKFKKKS